MLHWKRGCSIGIGELRACGWGGQSLRPRKISRMATISRMIKVSLSGRMYTWWGILRAGASCVTGHQGRVSGCQHWVGTAHRMSPSTLNPNLAAWISRRCSVLFRWIRVRFFATCALDPAFSLSCTFPADVSYTSSQCTGLLRYRWSVFVVSISFRRLVSRPGERRA